ncbi:MAG: NAAT family transporter [Alphaproteobacteria bacterium]|jgi:multiple antibiotic resistance protein|nr:NAAT family transporter [Alphaproteobacteria bacterium]
MTELVLTAAVALFVAIDPLGVGAVFVGLTEGQSRRERRRLALRGVVLSAAILLVFALAGEELMGALGIGLPAVRIAGGILLLLLAVDMVLARPSGMRTMTGPESAEADRRHDISVFPLAIPLIAGPGAITMVILFMGQTEDDPIRQLAFLAVLVAMLLTTLLVLLFAVEVTRVLGVTGINVLNRVLGILLAALACQFVLDGLAASALFDP